MLYKRRSILFPFLLFFDATELAVYCNYGNGTSLKLSDADVKIGKPGNGSSQM